jgi:hypothetical protein
MYYLLSVRGLTGILPYRHSSEKKKLSEQISEFITIVNRFQPSVFNFPLTFSIIGIITWLAHLFEIIATRAPTERDSKNLIVSHDETRTNKRQ